MGTLRVVATPIGNLQDISARAAAALVGASLVCCEDTRRTATLLRHVGSAAPMLATHEHNEAARATEIAERVAAGEEIVLVSDAGLPSVSDPGRRVVEAVRAAGGVVEVIPGPSAVATALVASGFATEPFTFVGFFPRRNGDVDRLLERFDATATTIVGFESPNRLARLLSHLASRDPSREVAVCRELTKMHEEVAVGPVATIAERFSGPPKGEVTVVLAPVAVEEPRDGALAAAAERVVAAGMSVSDGADLLAAIGPWRRNAAYSALTEAARDSR